MDIIEKPSSSMKTRDEHWNFSFFLKYIDMFAWNNYRAFS